MDWLSGADDLHPEDLVGFFEGRSRKPTPVLHLAALRSASEVILARDEHGQVVGFISAISNGVLAAYIPMLNVRRPPEARCRHRSPGQNAGAAPYYMVDVVCDPDLMPFSERLSFAGHSAAILRRPATPDLGGLPTT